MPLSSYRNVFVFYLYFLACFVCVCYRSVTVCKSVVYNDSILRTVHEKNIIHFNLFSLYAGKYHSKSCVFFCALLFILVISAKQQCLFMFRPFINKKRTSFLGFFVMWPVYKGLKVQWVMTWHLALHNTHIKTHYDLKRLWYDPAVDPSHPHFTSCYKRLQKQIISKLKLNVASDDAFVQSVLMMYAVYWTGSV